MTNPEPTTTLGDQLPKEIERCQELLAVYESLGPVGVFGHAAISEDIRKAHQSIADGNLFAMLEAYNALKDCE